MALQGCNRSIGPVPFGIASNLNTMIDEQLFQLIEATKPGQRDTMSDEHFTQFMKANLTDEQFAQFIKLNESQQSKP